MELPFDENEANLSAKAAESGGWNSVQMIDGHQNSKFNRTNIKPFFNKTFFELEFVHSVAGFLGYRNPQDLLDLVRNNNLSTIETRYAYNPIFKANFNAVYNNHLLNNNFIDKKKIKALYNIDDDIDFIENLHSILIQNTTIRDALAKVIAFYIQMQQEALDIKRSRVRTGNIINEKRKELDIHWRNLFEALHSGAGILNDKLIHTFNFNRIPPGKINVLNQEHKDFTPDNQYTVNNPP